MIATLLFCFMPPLQQAVPAKEISWVGLRQAFPKSLEFPQTTRQGKPLPSAVFEQRLRNWAQQPLVAAQENRSAVYLGDLIQRCQEKNWGKDFVAAQLRELAEALPQDQLEQLAQLLEAAAIQREDWKPSEPKEDGILFGPTWDLPEGEYLEHDGKRSVEQAATIIMADIAAIKLAEHDFPRYFLFPENAYLKVEPREGRYFRVADDRKICQAALIEVAFEADLPFPFSTYTFDLSILHRTEDDGSFFTYVFGRSEDLHWLNGYDRLVPVRNQRGEICATLVIRQLALDIKGVPDKSKHHREGIRSGLGNLRRGAEAAFDGSWQGATPQLNSIPEFLVIKPTS